jgi:hypothetical protein
MIMKSTALITSIAILAAVFSVGANAQTGRPSDAEVKARSTASQAVAGDTEVGSYARYLMLNGTTRDEAIKAAQNTDHPISRQYATRTVGKRANSTTPIQQ